MALMLENSISLVPTIGAAGSTFSKQKSNVSNFKRHVNNQQAVGTSWQKSRAFVSNHVVVYQYMGIF